jgi:hypothetical protein
MSKSLIQKLNSLRDNLTGIKEKAELQKDILTLKFTHDDKLVLALRDKYCG